LKNPLGDLSLTLKLREMSRAAKLSNDSHPSPQSALLPLKLRVLLFNPTGVVVFLFLPREKTRARKNRLKHDSKRQSRQLVWSFQMQRK
jgi:hypothetical protein